MSIKDYRSRAALEHDDRDAEAMRDVLGSRVPYVLPLEPVTYEDERQRVQSLQTLLLAT